MLGIEFKCITNVLRKVLPSLPFERKVSRSYPWRDSKPQVKEVPSFSKDCVCTSYEVIEDTVSQ